MSFVIAWASIGLTHSVHAATYTTPAIPTTTYPVEQLSWIVTNLTDVSLIVPEYQTKATSDESDHWQVLSDFNCQEDEQLLKCRAAIPPLLQDILQVRLTYPDTAYLQTFNLTLSQDQSEMPTHEHEQIYYSDFKILDPNLEATTLSWREQALTSTPRDRLIVQTRASHDGVSWTPWQGNAKALTLTDLNPEATAGSRPGHLDLYGVPTSGYDYLLATYPDDSRLYTLASPAAFGADEAAAFAQLTLALESVADLHLGQEIMISETVGADTYHLRGLISDKKDSTNEISVFSWQGAIPIQNEAICGTGMTFCYSPTATIQPLVTSVFPTPETNDETDYPQLTLAITSSRDDPTPVTYTPVLESLEFYRYLAPTCLEYYQDTADSATSSASLASSCKTQAIALPNSQEHQPQQLQYRIIYGFAGDVEISEVFLHQNTPANYASSSNIMTNSSYRLRGGKTFQAGNSRPYFWH